ncbi:hypothetical protein RJ639_012941 [Escallonia herrerae]|uniref:25S rRNA (uridine-N(3))-methyltransferase BMT5-like domain-containing protein n=1 Tax=Escallonia herrerae TaxID=1293975 RepID=A0AA88VNN7_9ASTE|nr:hypothetical protein RJ639_012941 [Escallonia herrerae]
MESFSFSDSVVTRYIEDDVVPRDPQVRHFYLFNAGVNTVSHEVIILYSVIKDKLSLSSFLRSLFRPFMFLLYLQSDVLIKKYREAKSNLGKLQRLGASLSYGVDATKMKLHTDLQMQKFDRIVYSFPHADFHGKEDKAPPIRHSCSPSLSSGFGKEEAEG